MTQPWIVWTLIPRAQNSKKGDSMGPEMGAKAPGILNYGQ